MEQVYHYPVGLAQNLDPSVQVEGAAVGVSEEQGEAVGVLSVESGAMEACTRGRKRQSNAGRVEQSKRCSIPGLSWRTSAIRTTGRSSLQGIIGQPLLELPHGSTQGEFSNKPVPAYLKRWRQLPEHKLLFWSKWSRDYLLSLQQRV
ncbi:hypothetical protein ACLKA7_004947 [Drosophila subpalustris]